MATIFGSELSPFEKEAELMYMESTIALSKIGTMRDIINSQYERTLMECDFYALSEGSTYDEYDRMILEATIDKDGKQMGIIRSLINAIGDAIGKIGAWIQKACGANMERLNTVPDDTTGTVSGESNSKLEAAAEELPKFLDGIKKTLTDIENAAKEHKAITIGAASGAALLASFGLQKLTVFINGTKEADDAKKEGEVTVKKKTIDEQIRAWLGIQTKVKETTDHANKVLEFLKKGPNLVKDAAQNNAQRMADKEYDKAQANDQANNSNKSSASSGPKQINIQGRRSGTTFDIQGNESVSTERYGLSAYDGLFMETSKNAMNSFSKGVASVNAAISANNRSRAKQELNRTRKVLTNPNVDQKERDAWTVQINELQKRVDAMQAPEQKPQNASAPVQPTAQAPANNTNGTAQPAQIATPQAPAQPANNTAATATTQKPAAKPTKTKSTKQPKAQATANTGNSATQPNAQATTNATNNGNSNATAAKPGSKNKTTKAEDPNNLRAIDISAQQVDRSDDEYEDGSVPVKTHKIFKTQREKKYRDLNKKAEDIKPGDVSYDAPTIQYPGPVGQANMKNSDEYTDGGSVRATTKNVGVGIKDPNSTAAERRETLKNAVKNAEDMSTPTNFDAKMRGDTEMLPWYKKAIAWIEGVLQVLALIIPAAGKSLTDSVASICSWIKNGGNPAEVQNADQTNAGAQQVDIQSNESVDLFGIAEDYNAMMERPSVEAVQAFEEIIQNL